MSRYRVAMDIGGTFTDAVAYDEATGQYSAGKASTTPGELSVGVHRAMRTVVDDLSTVSFAVHGTTQGLNAFLQRRGEKVLLIASAGAGDVYQIARGNRTEMYEVQYRKPRPLASRSDTAEVRGRLDARGREVEPLNHDDVVEAARRYREGGYTSIAVALLFSYECPDHELQAQQVLRQELGAEAPISLSHRLAREWREYERTSTAVLDAYTAPIVRTYLAELSEGLRADGMDVPLHIMQSSGGIITARSARDHTVQTLLSGPVGGAMGGVSLARLTGHRNLICVDMGGTSFDVSLIVDGEADISTEASLEGFPLLMPVVNIHTIGAGGGSVAYREAGGLRVGPRSAGASPGPACYGRGGAEPTVTDANVALGRVDPGAFAGGEFTLDTEASHRALATLGSELGLETAEMAQGIVDVVNAKMAQAIRTLTVEKGIEPRNYALVAFGGAGPMHGVFLAEELGIERMIVPRFPGAFSAWGMLETRLRRDTARGFPYSHAAADLETLQKIFGEMGAEMRAQIESEGVSHDSVVLHHAIDARYIGQEYTLTIPAGSHSIGDADGWREQIKAAFDAAHHSRFGHSNAEAPIEFTIVRTTGFGDLGRATPRPMGSRPPSDPVDIRPVRFGDSVFDTPLLRRDGLAPRSDLSGPLVISEPTATTVIPPGWRLEVDDYGNLSALAHDQSEKGGPL
ncbi:hydantoinase/oxoprolinase family protein [Candidatus Poriferisodalis sp.]|uniref:hydantoinase/oxoprolinase family protein n=1 Tax=Candidatus Poriferisodalis sp. TaxID=3101277 RepID=UPI003B014F01